MSERAPWKTSTAYSWTIVVFDSSGAAVTGLLNAGFTKQLAKNDTNDATAVTVTEIDAANLPGWYKVTYTPGSSGHWACRVAHATHNPRGWLDEIQVGARGFLDDLDISNLDATVSSRLASASYTAPPSVASIVNGVWDELQSSHVTAGTMGKLMGFLDALISSRSSHTAADVRVEMDANSVDLNVIIAYVDELETRLTGARASKLDFLDALVSSRATPADVPSPNANADALLDRAAAVDGYTVRQALAIIGAVVLSKCSGEPANPVTFRSMNDLADRVAISIDANGNRTAVAITPP